MSLDIAKLSSPRMAERTISAGILEDPHDPSLGKIIYVIDLPLPLVVGEPIEKTIIDTLKTEYFSPEKRLPLYQFEDSIKQVNAALAELAENNNSDWVGHVHSVLALWCNNEIFVTYAGRAAAVMVRRENLISIIDQAPTERRVLVHKTFANLVSGQLAEGDVLLFGNGEVNRHFSPQFLVQSQDEDPSDTVDRMTSAIHRLNLKTITAIVAKVNHDKQNDLHHQPDPQDDVDPDQLSLNIPTGQIDSELTVNYKGKKSADHPALEMGTTSEILRSWINSLKKLTLNARNVWKNDNGPEIQYTDGESGHAEPTIHAETSKTINKDVEDVEIAPPTIQRTPGQKINTSINRHGKTLRRLFYLCWHRIISAPKKLVIFVFVVVLVVVASSSIIKLKNNRSTVAVSDNELNSKIEQISTLYQAASTVSNSQPDSARKSLIQAVNLLTPILNSNKQKDRITQLSDQSLALLNQLNHATFVDQNQKNKVNPKTDHFVVVGSYLFTSQSDKSAIFRQIIGKNDALTEVVTLSDKSAVTNMFYKEKEHSLTISTSTKRLFNYQTDGKNTLAELKAPSGTSWPDIQSLTWYQNNLYVLEKNTGVVWKYLSVDGTNFTGRQRYIIDQSLIKNNGISITTDGYLYELYQDGSLVKMSKGKNQTISKYVLPEPNSGVANPIMIITDEAANSVYIVDQTRVIEISKLGVYSHQFILTGGSIRAAYATPKTKQAWVLSDQYIYNVPL